MYLSAFYLDKTIEIIISMDKTVGNASAGKEEAEQSSYNTVNILCMLFTE